MSKITVKIIALTLTLFAYMGERGMADGQWNLHVFTGCVASSQKCKNMCGDTYRRVGGFSTQLDSNKCSDDDKPLACECDYKTEE